MSNKAAFFNKESELLSLTRANARNEVLETLGISPCGCGDFGESLEHRIGDFFVEFAEDGAELCSGARSDECGCHAGPGHDPGEGDRGDIDAETIGCGGYGFNDLA